MVSVLIERRVIVHVIGRVAKSKLERFIADQRLKPTGSECEHDATAQELEAGLVRLHAIGQHPAWRPARATICACPDISALFCKLLSQIGQRPPGASAIIQDINITIGQNLEMS